VDKLRGEEIMQYRGNYKIKCQCGYEGISFQFGDELECPECEKEKEGIKLIPLEEWNTEDIVNSWVSELEDKNFHSLTNMPTSINYILEKHINNKSILENIMRDLYKDGLMD
jgi:hypothetical protein